MLDGWSVDELKRQKDSGLFMRLALSKNKEEILKLAQHGQIILSAKDIVNNDETLTK
jgi:predicted nuclease of restriction endonuclease-like (RecB) superfamily